MRVHRGHFATGGCAVPSSQLSRGANLSSTQRRRSAAFYASPVADFLESPDSIVYAALTQPHGFTLTNEQLTAWKLQLGILRAALEGHRGWIHLEFDIPRLGRRVDAVLVSGAAVIPIEFKVNATRYERADYEQAWDYGLDLKHFHHPSHNASVFPILCATDAPKGDTKWAASHTDGLRPPFRCNSKQLRTAIELAISSTDGQDLDAAEWGLGVYSPTPTILEAARALYARHTVQDITRNDAEAVNLSATTAAIEDVIFDAESRKRKAIVFVTGVPGAGKTLVGLNIATRHGKKSDSTHTVYLSGNGPLVAVLREALAKDEHDRRRNNGQASRIGERRIEVQAFIQEVRHFVKAAYLQKSDPDDRVVVFDEAQRAWNQRQFSSFMARKYGMADIQESQSQYLIRSIDQRQDWCVIVCLVGGGQEINTGEAGIAAWIDAIRSSFPSWDVYISPELNDSEFAAQTALENLVAARPDSDSVSFLPTLHLSTSMRSYRASNLSQFVKALLDGDVSRASEQFQQFRNRYPIVVTRSMSAARKWVRGQRRGTQRIGLVASSAAERLKPHAVDVRVNVDPLHWFLAPPSDTRSSQYLEDAATEFQVQGLELDWAIVAWDADFRRGEADWSYHHFNGDHWKNSLAEEKCRYLKNAYRVLLTRARQGMVIFVPPGRKRDQTRHPHLYDGIYRYLRSVGVPDIES
jgi:hypothetical protein